jgi:hypothetical protein
MRTRKLRRRKFGSTSCLTAAIYQVNRDELSAAYDELGKMLGRILTSPEKFIGDIKR